MLAVNLDNVTIIYVLEPIFENLSWEIHDDRVVGLIGPNGCGKSTVLQLIAGELTSETGFTTRKKNLTIGYLRQEPRLKPGHTVWQEALAASTELTRVETELNHIENRLAEPAVYGNEKKLARTLDRQAFLTDEYVNLGGPGYEGRVRSILHNLGFNDPDLHLPVDALSGGQKKLVGLARLLITKPDMLLLDEPDNHLDLDGKAFLERFIRNYQGAVIIVSHDRYLLDLVVDEIVELEDGHLRQFPGNYSEYIFDKQIALLRQKQLYEAQQKEIKRLEQSAKRMMLWGKIYDNEKFSRRGRNMLKRLEKIDRIERPTIERKQMGLELAGWRGSTKVLEILDLYKSFPSKATSQESASEKNILLAGLNLLIRRGERVGMVGPNGSGKSVLFRLILGEMQSNDGEIKIGPSVKIGYYSQEQETLHPERTLIDTVRSAAALSENRAVAFLGRFLFTYEQARGQVKNLSGGERSRLQMALLMLSGANFLLLDEPTNNLDIPSAEVLENALAEFEGAIFVISHDRYFLDLVVNRVVELDQGMLTEYIGNYSDYQAAKRGR